MNAGGTAKKYDIHGPNGWDSVLAPIVPLGLGLFGVGTPHNNAGSANVQRNPEGFPYVQFEALIFSFVPQGPSRVKKATPEHKEPCSAIVHLAGADTNEGALERLLYQEATPRSGADSSSEAALNEMGAIAGSVLNRVAFLNTTGLTQGQTMGFGNPGASIADVVYSRGNNPYPNKRTGQYKPIATQYAGFTPDGIDSGIQTRINNALNSDLGSADCTKLLHAYLIGQLGMDARSLDPYHGQTMGMRTVNSGTPFANSVTLGQLGRNVFFGLRR
jgi:hypothetical protein